MPEIAPEWLVPEWPAPPGVSAVSTLRIGGQSQAPYDGWNLAQHVGDVPAAVAHNRRLLRQALSLRHEPLWLQQVHGVQVVRAGDSVAHTDAPPEADASIASGASPPCVVLTADCLPVLFCAQNGSEVAAAHAGWRGLAAGILERTVASFATPAGELLAWLGPAIGPASFEVGAEVRARFVDADAAAANAFDPHGPRFMADLYALARQRLVGAGIRAGAIYGGTRCTFSEPTHFFSYRRQGTCGRMATLIWIAS